jgi:DedD protein
MRERLIGAAILVIIAVILIPWLVSHSHQPREQVRTLPVPNVESASAPAVLTLPPVPGSQVAVARTDSASKDASNAPRDAVKIVVPATAAPIVARHEKKQARPKSSTVSTPANTATKRAKKVSNRPSRTESASKPTAHSTIAKAGSGIEKGDWYLQVASFTSLKNASAMVEKLEQAGFVAAIAPHEAKDKTWHRVRVGPYPDKASAQKAATRVRSVSGSKSIVRQADGRGG